MSITSNSLFFALFVIGMLIVTMTSLRNMCFLIRRCNGKFMVPLMKTKTREEAESVLKKIASPNHEYKDFFYSIDPAYGWTSNTRVSLRYGFMYNPNIIYNANIPKVNGNANII